jgi:hypothetical protein
VLEVTIALIIPASLQITSFDTPGASSGAYFTFLGGSLWPLILILLLILIRMNRLFDHEKLDVYPESLAFVAWLELILQKLPKTIAARDQLDRAGTSIVLNLAEGNGKFTPPDRVRPQ